MNLFNKIDEALEYTFYPIPNWVVVSVAAVLIGGSVYLLLR